MATNNDIGAHPLMNPYRQAGIFLIASFVITAVGKLMHFGNLLELNPNFPWLSAASFMLMFAMFNSLSFLAVKNSGKHWGRSLTSFMVLAGGAGLIAYLFSSLSIWEAGSYSWIYVVLTFGYLVFVGIVGMMKNIVEFAQKEEWNQPRMRRRNDQQKRK